MALQQFVCVFAVVVILLCTGCHSQQPACLSGGQGAVGETLPWLAVITYSGYTFCQGSLITNQWVLTAARCSLHNYLSGAVVHLGVYNQSDQSEVTRRVEYFICHQDLNFQTSENDICVVKLSAPVNFTDYIQPICLAAENSTFYDGTPSLITSIGYSYYYQPATPQEIDVSVVGNNKCTCSFKIYYSIYTATENQLCGSKNGSTYYTDMGAALVTKKDSTWVQSGIFSVISGWTQAPTLFTTVSRYQKWISDRVTGMEPGFVTFTSPGKDSDLNYTCPTPAPTTPNTLIPYDFTSKTTTPETTTPTTNKDRVFTEDSIWNKGGNLIPMTHFISLFALVLFLHVFVGHGGL